jgi:transposase InsO family protein
VEVEPVCTIPARSAVKFIRGLVCHFGVPNRIITNNGSRFTSGLFWEYCASAGIKIYFASVAYPRSNGQAERANAKVLKGLKTRSFNAKLEACGKKWLDNLQSILWSIRTTATKPTGETPFFLVYGAEAVLPTDVKFGLPRVLAFNEIRQEDLIKDRLLQLEEAWCQAALRATRYQQGLRRYHSRHVWARTLEVGNLVLRRILSREGLHKVSPMWEGPFKVTHIARPGSARLETAEGVPVGNPWNIAHMRKFYP